MMNFDPVAKKMFCPVDQRLVKGKLKKEGGTTQIVCSRCGRTLATLSASAWRPA